MIEISETFMRNAEIKMAHADTLEAEYDGMRDDMLELLGRIEDLHSFVAYYQSKWLLCP